MLRKYSQGLQTIAATQGVTFVDQYTPIVATITSGRSAGILTSNPGMIDELMDSMLVEHLPTLAILEESLNEDYTVLNAMRRDALVFTSKPLTRPLEVTGEMTATLWASSDARDTDWIIKLVERRLSIRVRLGRRLGGSGRPSQASRQ